MRGCSVTVPADSTPAIGAQSLRPYISLLFLQGDVGQEELAFAKLAQFMMTARARRAQGASVLEGAGIAGASEFLRDGSGAHGVDQIYGFVHRIEASPGWAIPGSGYLDICHSLCIVLRRARIFAIYCDSSMRSAIGRWLRRDPRPPLRRVSPNVVQGAFLRGEAKGLWLHGTHVRSAIRPDTKHMTGMRVQDALSPLEDSSFAMSAAKAALPDDFGLTALLGTVGTVPRKGLVWNRQAREFSEFMAASTEALELIEETIDNRAFLNDPFPILAVESHDLSEVRGAYDILTLDPDDLPTSPDVTDEMTEVAEVLRRATLKVLGSPDSADFELEVGMDGSSDGALQATVRLSGDDVAFNFGYSLRGEPTNPGSVRTVLDALETDDQFAVYYDSGHVITPKGIWRRNPNSAPFPNWSFQDFPGIDITAEKPGITPEQIHSRVGSSTDNSLFGWVTRHYSSGWLICDDGPGEAADFLHISPDGVLSLIHVKGAHSSSPVRNVAVSAFEVVASQAAKNSRHLVDLDILAEHLLISSGRAAWTDGWRIPDRAEFLEALGSLMPSDRRQVVIVQPHVSEAIYTRVRASEANRTGAPSPELFRLSTLETLLHTTRAAAVAVGADLEVIGSKK